MTNVDITAPTVLRGIHKDAREHVKAAALLGWTGRRAGSGGLILYSPDGEHHVRIPITMNHHDAAKRIARDIVRYTPEETKRSVTDHVVDGDDQPSIISLGTLVKDAQGVFPPAMVAQMEPEDDYPKEDPSTGRDTFPAKPAPAAFITQTKPWMARVSSDGAKADLYESPAVIERTWSDGSTDYMCSYCEEKYVAEKARSVSSHYARHTVTGETPRSTQEPTVFDAKIEGYRTVRVAHLAKEIYAALDAVDVETIDQFRGGAEEVARLLAEHIVRERIAKGKERIEDEPQPSTPEDILARIKTLLLRDEHKQIEVMETQAANLRAQVEELAAEAAAAKVETRQAQEKWNALRELISE